MQSTSIQWIDFMATDDKDFFVALGQRIAQLRKERGWTQQEMADKLGIAQQTLAHYEVGRNRMPASALPMLATLFALPIDELLGHSQANRRHSKRGPASRLQQQIEAVAQLPTARQRFVSEMLDTILAQANS